MMTKFDSAIISLNKANAKKGECSILIYSDYPRGGIAGIKAIGKSL